VKLNDFQRRAVNVPECYDLALLGGRSGGKSTAAFAIALDHCMRYGPLAHVLYLRKSYPALRQPFEEAQRTMRDLGATFDTNKHEMILTFPNGAKVEFAPLPDAAYFRERHQGHSHSLIIADEAATWATPEVLDLAYSLLRAPAPMQPRFILNSNPGVGSPWLIARFWSRASRLPAGTPFRVSELGDRECVVLHSTYRDNVALDSELARKAIVAGAGNNAALAEMYLNGTFEALSHQFFGLREANFVAWPKFHPNAFPLSYRVGIDHGSKNPFAAVWLARFKENAVGPDGNRYSRGSWVAFFESHSADADANYLSVSREVTVADIAGQLLGDAERLGFVRIPRCLIDAAAFAKHGHSVNGKASTLADDYKAFGIPVEAAPKPRLDNSLGQVNNLLAGAGSAVEGLYVDRRACPYLVYSLTNATSDERNPEVLSSGYPYDHPLDALRYGLALKAKGGQLKRIGEITSAGIVLDGENPRVGLAIAEAQAYARTRDSNRARFKTPEPPAKARGLDLSRLTHAPITRK
jgi:hypothetical protein